LADIENPEYSQIKAEMQDTTTNYAPYPIYNSETKILLDKTDYITYVK